MTRAVKREHHGGPRGVAGWVVRRVAPAGSDPRDATVRTVLGEIEGYVSVGVSAVLSGIKFALGAMSGSVALVADGFNNLADIGSSLLIALSFRWSRQPRDKEHPFGHGRIESVATLVLAMFLLAVGVQLARNGVRRLWVPEPIRVSVWLLAVVVVTVAAKAWLALFARALARWTGSQVIEADSWNHLFDIAATSLVLVALGSAWAGYPRVDGYATLGVSLCIIYTGWRYAREAVNEIIGLAPLRADLEAIRQAALSVPGVQGVHDVIIHKYGDVRLVSLHMEVGAEQSLLEAHQLAERVEATVSRVANAKVVAHVDPVDRNHPAYAEVEKALRRFVKEHADVVGYHDLRVHGPFDRYDFSVDLVVRPHVTPDRFEEFLEEARECLRKDLHRAGNIDLGVETEYASDPEHRHAFAR